MRRKKTGIKDSNGLDVHTGDLICLWDIYDMKWTVMKVMTSRPLSSGDEHVVAPILPCERLIGKKYHKSQTWDENQTGYLLSALRETYDDVGAKTTRFWVIGKGT